jgi:hypothetical protein
MQAVIDKIKDSLTKALSDKTTNGTTGAFASAARDNVTYLTEARDKMETLLAWLYTVGALGSPPGTPPTYVSNISAAYNIHGYVRETIISLHYARHWAMISAVYHQSADARDLMNLPRKLSTLSNLWERKQDGVIWKPLGLSPSYEYC